MPSPPWGRENYGYNSFKKVQRISGEILFNPSFSRITSCKNNNQRTLQQQASQKHWFRTTHAICKKNRLSGSPFILFLCKRWSSIKDIDSPQGNNGGASFFLESRLSSGISTSSFYCFHIRDSFACVCWWWLCKPTEREEKKRTLVTRGSRMEG